MQRHSAIVSQLSSRVADFYSRSIPFRIYHGNTNSTRKSARTTANSLDVSSLNRVLSINQLTKTCICEPNVPMDKLLASTIKHKLMPPVVPEFPGITVGGAFSGTGGESSSFKYGFFDRSVTAIEMILADGTVTTADANHNADLFHGAASTFGTLGVLTLLHLKLIPCKPYVELTYHPVDSVSAAVNTISSFMPSQIITGSINNNNNNSTAATTTASTAPTAPTSYPGNQPVDFLDGVMYSPHQGVIMSGRFSDGPSDYSTDPAPAVTTFHKTSDEWFYLHAQRHSKPAPAPAPQAADAASNSAPPRAARPHRDLIPLESYIFRFDRGAFWMGKFGFQYFLTPFTRTTRRVLDRFMHTRELYNGLHSSGLTEDFLIQDMAVPASKMEEFSDWLDKDPEAGCSEIYPRWFCPLMDHPDHPDLKQSEQQQQQEEQPGNQIEVTDFTMNPRLAMNTNTNTTTSPSTDYLLNIGVWGPLSSSSLKPRVTVPSRSPIKTNRAIEEKLAQLQGRKWLYAQTFYTDDEFWQIYDRKVYDALRKKYRAQGLPTVYDKVGPKIQKLRNVRAGTSPEDKARAIAEAEKEARRPWSVWEIWPAKGWYGLISVLKGGDYLRKSK